jgi:hypothetical protein
MEGSMGDGVPQVRRRSVLTRGLAGLAAGVAFFAGRSDSRPAVVPLARSTSRTTELYGRGWYAHSADLKFGELPRAGDRYAVYGDLFESLDGRKIGDFSSANFALATHGSTVEVHTLNLATGSIVGIGSGTGAKRTYAIVGGTGAYVGARGSYIAEQDIYGFGGNGTAKFSLTLTTED